MFGLIRLYVVRVMKNAQQLTFLLLAGLCSSPWIQAQSTELRHDNARWLHSAILAGDWLVNNQEKRTNGSQPFSADYGRWLYEYKLPDRSWRGSTCWTTATGIMALSSLYERTGFPRYKEALTRAALYLKSLQILDFRNQLLYGALAEHTPLSDFSFPRDGVTGGLGGYLALYRLTGDKEYLERAELFGNWFLRAGINPQTQWPYYTVRFDGRHIGPSDSKASYMEAWQAGSGLYFYQLYKVTGKRIYFDKGVVPFAEGLVGKSPEMGLLRRAKENNDDFATITLLCAYRELGDKRYWDAAIQRLTWLMDSQREDGAVVPGNTGGVYISALTALDAMDLAAEKKLAIDAARLRRFVRRCAEFAVTVQETKPDDVKAFGGFYGQLNLADFRREWIHARATTYSVIFNLRNEGLVKVPFYSAFGWD